jgi:hypothetical protein
MIPCAADQNNNALRLLDRNGTVSTLAGSGGAPGATVDGGPGISRLNGPLGLVEDPSSQVLYFTDYLGPTVRSYSPSGEVTTIAGVPGSAGTTGDGGLCHSTNPFLQPNTTNSHARPQCARMRTRRVAYS